MATQQTAPPITWHIFPIQDHPFIPGLKRELQLVASDERVNDANSPQGGWFIAKFKVVHYTETTVEAVTTKKFHKELDREITFNADGKPNYKGVVPMFNIGTEADPIMVTDFQYVMMAMQTYPDYVIVKMQVDAKNVRDSVTGLSDIDVKCNYNMS